MKRELLEVLVCPHCKNQYRLEETDRLICTGCAREVPLKNSIPVFTEVPDDLNPSEKRSRSPQGNTPWREANTRFLEDQVGDVNSNPVILDIGAGRGDFTHILTSRRYFAVDIFPYPEIDLVCDLTKSTPFASGSIDIIVLMNVLEHLPSAGDFIKSLSALLRPNGRILVTVPFLLKIHQAPYDFARYTHFLLERMGRDAGLEVESIEGFYDPVFLSSESVRYIRNWVLPKYGRVKRVTLKIILRSIEMLIGVMKLFIGQGYTQQPSDEISPAPVGYHVTYRKS